MAPRLDSTQNPWMTVPGITAVMAAIAGAGGEARFVGGAVRDALAGRKVEDIDLAVNLPPEEVMTALANAGIKTAPTGVDHGTVTAVVDHKGYEITTLRRDVATDGRHATVAFTDDWEADASRRDFTFNALYADASGTVYDYFGGHEDLQAGHVRFIGKAEARIREDVLRILRFFRFYAWMGQGDPDDEALAGCRELAHLLPKLSAERAWKEISKLLLAPDPIPACRLMFDHGIMSFAFPEAEDIKRLSGIVQLEKTFSLEPNSLRRLTSILKPGAEEDAISRLRLSNREAETLRSLSSLPDELSGRTDASPLRRVLYVEGADNVRDGLLLMAAEGKRFDLKSALNVVAAWERPIFPLRGADILALGVEPGPSVGEILRIAENWWQERDFCPSKDECLGEVQRIISER